MIFIFKIGTLLALMMSAVLAVRLWPHRRTTLTKLYSLNVVLWLLWAFWVIMTLITDDPNLKIYFTKVRQVSNPFLAANWLLVLLVIFHKQWIRKYKKVYNFLYIIPVATSVSSILSICGFKYFEGLVMHDFAYMPDSGLMKYTSGIVLSSQFTQSSILMIVMLLVLIYNLFHTEKHLQKLSLAFFVTTVFQISMEFISRSEYGGPFMVQMSVATAAPTVLAFYFSIRELQFLNVKSVADELAFNFLPAAVLTLNNRDELWDANQKAIELFNIHDEEIGSHIISDQRFSFLVKKEQFVEIKNHKYQIEEQTIILKNRKKYGRIITLNDVTEIQNLNNELAESNSILSAMNAEIMKVTGFNKKIQTVLSHDLAALLKVSDNLLEQCHTTNEHDKSLLGDLKKTNKASLGLLENILSWNSDEKSEAIDVHLVVQNVVADLSVVAKSKSVNIKFYNTDTGSKILSSERMLQSILRNLILNAIQASRPMSDVTVSTKVADDKFKIIINDCGVGFDLQVLESIKLKASRIKNSQYGFGVGLSFTLEFVKQLSGSIEFESEPGKGTSVYLTFPLV